MEIGREGPSRTYFPLMCHLNCFFNVLISPHQHERDSELNMLHSYFLQAGRNIRLSVISFTLMYHQAFKRCAWGPCTVAWVSEGSMVILGSDLPLCFWPWAAWGLWFGLVDNYSPGSSSLGLSSFVSVLFIISVLLNDQYSDGSVVFLWPPGHLRTSSALGQFLTKRCQGSGWETIMY